MLTNLNIWASLVTGVVQLLNALVTFFATRKIEKAAKDAVIVDAIVKADGISRDIAAARGELLRDVEALQNDPNNRRSGSDPLP